MAIQCVHFPLETEIFAGPIPSNARVDFSTKPVTWQEKAIWITLLVLKIILLPWGLIEGIRFLIGRVAMMGFYPAQSTFLRNKFLPQLHPKRSDEWRQESFTYLQAHGFATRHVVLEQRGVRYSGVMAAHHGNMNNGKWMLYATGNAAFVESSLADVACHYRPSGFNILMVNGPSVGRSEGLAGPETLGDAQEVGISFLEEVINAQKIALVGLSLGGAAIAQAIVQHDFRGDIDYLVCRQMTFHSVSRVCGDYVKRFTKSSCLGAMAQGLIHFCGLEMNLTRASRKLVERGIHEIIMQATDDDGIVSKEASLAHQLRLEGVVANKLFIDIPDADHNLSLRELNLHDFLPRD